MKICSICDGEYAEYGNNAQPINGGRCCDACNATRVIPERMRRICRGEPACETTPPIVH
jgi:hypothetical protein